MRPPDYLYIHTDTDKNYYTPRKKFIEIERN